MSRIKKVIIAPIKYESYLKPYLNGLDYSDNKRLFFCSDNIELDKLYWANNVWLEPKVLKIKSIKDASRQLKELYNFWYYIPNKEHRRALLIQNELLPKKEFRMSYPFTKGFIRRGEWTLLDRDTILYSLQHSHPIPLGQCEFTEDKIEPPSRAYLKLWEVFSLYMEPPANDDEVIDLGSSPGGWTWVLAKNARHVLSVDTASIEIKSTNVEYLSKDAFSLNPKDYLDVSYVFSDMACEPEKLWQLVNHWSKHSNAHTFVCTIKLNSSVNEKEIIKKFEAIPNSRVIHLYHNKHELTWLYSRKFSIA